MDEGVAPPAIFLINAVVAMQFEQSPDVGVGTHALELTQRLDGFAVM